VRLEGKSAIVTGAGRGIGKAIARKFLEEGTRVMICDLEPERLEATREELAAIGTVQSEMVNVTSREVVERLVDRAKEEFGPIDILANNAGISRFEPFLEITDKNWNDTLAVNLTGVFQCSQVVAAEMKNQGSGTIVNMDLPTVSWEKRDWRLGFGGCGTRAGAYQPRPYLLTLFTGVRGREILRTSPLRSSTKFPWVPGP
jgi:NAD(P)-dependent dehydrogenase (short-subunit alcohol dehydrogenase family)